MTIATCTTSQTDPLRPVTHGTRHMWTSSRRADPTAPSTSTTASTESSIRCFMTRPTRNSINHHHSRPCQCGVRLLIGRLRSSLLTGRLRSSLLTGCLPSSHLTGRLRSSLLTGCLPSCHFTGHLRSQRSLRSSCRRSGRPRCRARLRSVPRGPLPSVHLHSVRLLNGRRSSRQRSGRRRSTTLHHPRREAAHPSTPEKQHTLLACRPPRSTRQ